MKLKTIRYAEHMGEPLEWTVDGLELGPRNLLVGKNATGKSRCLNVISALAQCLSGQRGPTMSSDYDCTWEDASTTYRYELRVAGGLVESEKLTIDNNVKLDRGQGGVGEIWANQVENGTLLKFQTPPTDFAATARRDTIQHPFLEPLFTWADSLRHYHFGTQLGKDTIAVKVLKQKTPVNERDQNSLVH